MNALLAGERTALVNIIDHWAPQLWRWVRTGFMLSKSQPPLHFVGLEDPQAVYWLVRQILASALRPEHRPKLEAEATATILGELRRIAEHHPAVISGQAANDLDRAILGASFLEVDAPLDPVTAALHLQLQAELPQMLQKLRPAERQALVARYQEGQSWAQIAQTASRGQVATRTHARRGLRALRRDLVLRNSKHLANDTFLEALLAGQPAALHLTPATLERLRFDVLTRVDPVAPRPFAHRALWAAGMALVAILAGGLAVAGVVPIKQPRQSVVELVCGPCAPGALAQLRARAPRRYREFALVRQGPEGWSPLLVDDHGGTLRVEGSGAVLISKSFILPTSGRALAVFARRPLSAKDLQDLDVRDHFVVEVELP